MDINVVVKLALDKCISIYDEMASEILEMGESGRIYGRIPKVLIIKYGDGYLKKGDFILTDIWNVWCFHDELLKNAEKKREPVSNPVSGMFFAEAWAEFMIDREKQRVYINYYFGPRYARGIRFTLEEQNGVAGLVQEEVLWVS